MQRKQASYFHSILPTRSFDPLDHEDQPLLLLLRVIRAIAPIVFPRPHAPTGWLFRGCMRSTTLPVPARRRVHPGSDSMEQRLTEGNTVEPLLASPSLLSLSFSGEYPTSPAHRKRYILVQKLSLINKSALRRNSNKGPST